MRQLSRINRPYKQIAMSLIVNVTENTDYRQDNAPENILNVCLNGYMGLQNQDNCWEIILTGQRACLIVSFTELCQLELKICA
jgi:hypothetical protein